MKRLIFIYQYNTIQNTKHVDMIFECYDDELHVFGGDLGSWLLHTVITVSGNDVCPTSE